MLFDAVGDMVWTVAVTLVGYYFGSKIPNIDHYILLAVLVVVVITLAPTIYHLVKAYRESKQSPAEKP
jgi:membrane-associated protein